MNYEYPCDANATCILTHLDLLNVLFSEVFTRNGSDFRMC